MLDALSLYKLFTEADDVLCEGACSRVQFRWDDLGCVEYGVRCDGEFDWKDNGEELGCLLVHL